MHLTKHELIEAAYEMTGGSVKDLSIDQLERLMTIVQFVFDLSLNEIERRGELTFVPGPNGDLVPIIPYCADHGVTTILTRRNPLAKSAKANREQIAREGTAKARQRQKLRKTRRYAEPPASTAKAN